MSSKNINIDFDKFVEVFNNDGRHSAERYIEDTYGIAYNIAQRRLSKETSYVYNRSVRKYIIKDNTEGVFISTDKLFEGKSTTKTLEPFTKELDACFNDILSDILKDRLLELNRYFNISQSSRVVTINMKLLKSLGYKLNILD